MRSSQRQLAWLDRQAQETEAARAAAASDSREVVSSRSWTDSTGKRHRDQVSRQGWGAGVQELTAKNELAILATQRSALVARFDRLRKEVPPQTTTRVEQRSVQVARMRQTVESWASREVTLIGEQTVTSFEALSFSDFYWRELPTPELGTKGYDQTAPDDAAGRASISLGAVRRATIGNLRLALERVAANNALARTRGLSGPDAQREAEALKTLFVK